jgi:hypothetical protein
MASQNPTSHLEAVNIILAAMGEPPVNTVAGDIPLAATVADRLLTETSLNVQKRGWFFNTEYHIMQPGNDGTIKVPWNTLTLRTVGPSAGTPVAIRNGQIYNMTPWKHSFQWSEPLYVEIIVGLQFEELLPSARQYVVYRAARSMIAREQGDELALRVAQEDENRALAELNSEQLTAEPLSLRQSPDFGDSLYGIGIPTLSGSI